MAGGGGGLDMPCRQIQREPHCPTPPQIFGARFTKGQSNTAQSNCRQCWLADVCFDAGALQGAPGCTTQTAQTRGGRSPPPPFPAPSLRQERAHLSGTPAPALANMCANLQTRFNTGACSGGGAPTFELTAFAFSCDHAP